MNIREISDVFKDTASNITALKSYNFGWASDRVRHGNTEDYQDLNAFPRLFFSVPTITSSDQTRKQDTYQVTLFFDDLLGYDNDGDSDLTLQIDKWAALQEYATAFIQRLNLIKQSILPNYLFIPDAPSFTFDSFVGIQRLVTVQVNFNLVVPTNCEVTVQRIINLVGSVIAQGLSEANIFLSTSVKAYVESKATSTGAIVSGQQQIIEVESNVISFALSSGDIVTVKSVAANTIASASIDAEIQRAINIISNLNATGQVSGDISLTLFATGSVDARATVNANLEVTTKGITECEANVTGTGITDGLIFITRILEAQSIAEASTQSEIILSKLLSGSVVGLGVSDANIQLTIQINASIQCNAVTDATLDVTTQNVTTFDANVVATATSDANVQLIIPISSSVDTLVITTANVTLTKVLEASATATAQTSSDAQITIPVNADASATANTTADAQLSYTVNAAADATAQTSADAYITRIISADATATANSSAEAGIGVTFVAAAVASASVTSASVLRTATMAASVNAAATVSATLTSSSPVDADATAFFLRVTTAGGSLTSTEQSAVDTLVKSLKSNGIWSSLLAIYPFVGGGQANPAAACAQNLKSASHTITFNGAMTFSSNGITGNGTNAYGNENFLPSSLASLDSASFGFYNGVAVNETKQTMGSRFGTNFFSMAHKFSGITYYGVNGGQAASTDTTSGLGLYVASRLNSTTTKLYINGTINSTHNIISTLTPGFSTSILSINNGGANTEFSAKNCRFRFIGNGLTDADVTALTSAIQTFQSNLGRAV